MVLVAATAVISIRKILAPQIAMLHERGYRVEVVASGADTSLLALPGVAAVHDLAMSREIDLGADLTALVAWWRLLRRTRPEAVVAFSPKASLLAMLTGAGRRVPLRVYTTGGLRLETSKGPGRSLLWAMEWVTCAAAHRVVANSPSLAKAYQRHRLGRGRLTWTMSRRGVDHQHFAPGGVVAADVPGPTAMLVLGYVGRVTTDKGIAVLAEALGLLRSRQVEARVVVVGPQEGPEAAELLRGLGRAVRHLHVTGAVDDVRPWYAAMDLLVLPSAREGFPNVVLEAAAMGVPAVVSDATGCVDSVDALSGRVFATGQAESLAAALAELLADGRLRSALGVGARQRVERCFDPPGVLSEQLDLMGLAAAGSRT